MSDETCPICLQDYVNKVRAGTNGEVGVEGIKVRDDHLTCVVKKRLDEGFKSTRDVRDIYVHER
jgi:hypothetical protein